MLRRRLIDPEPVTVLHRDNRWIFRHLVLMFVITVCLLAWIVMDVFFVEQTAQNYIVFVQGVWAFGMLLVVGLLFLCENGACECDRNEEEQLI
jgi:hypothetical protein